MKFDIQSIMQQVQTMQQEMEKKKQALKSKTVSADSGGGMVSVTMSCNYRITELKISKELANPDDLEMLEDLTIAAINKALADVAKTVEEEMGGITNMMPNIPGLNF